MLESPLPPRNRPQCISGPRRLRPAPVERVAHLARPALAMQRPAGGSAGRSPVPPAIRGTARRRRPATAPARAQHRVPRRRRRTADRRRRRRSAPCAARAARPAHRRAPRATASPASQPLRGRAQRLGQRRDRARPAAPRARRATPPPGRARRCRRTGRARGAPGSTRLQPVEQGFAHAVASVGRSPGQVGTGKRVPRQRPPMMRTLAGRSVVGASGGCERPRFIGRCIGRGANMRALSVTIRDPPKPSAMVSFFRRKKPDRRLRPRPRTRAALQRRELAAAFRPAADASAGPDTQLAHRSRGDPHPGRALSTASEPAPAAPGKPGWRERLRGSGFARGLAGAVLAQSRSSTTTCSTRSKPRC